MIIKEDVAKSLPCILVDDTDFKSVETGVVFGDVVVKYCKEGGSEVTKTILVGDWHEIGGGEYLVDFTNDELNTVGKFTYRVTASGILVYFGLAQIEESRIGESALNATGAKEATVNVYANYKADLGPTDIAIAANLAAIDAIAERVGPGSTECTVTIYETGTTTPVADADAWVSIDEAGGNVVAGTLQTNSSGQVKFMLDLGVTYYIWGQKDGVNITNPTEFTPS